MKILKNIFNRNKIHIPKLLINYINSNNGLSGKTNVYFYPFNLEKRLNTRTGIEFFIRPIKDDDVPLLLDFFNSLSPETRYFRFFSFMKKVPDDMLVRFTQIDYMRDMTLVAMDPADPTCKILAVASFSHKPDQSDAEFAVVTSDEWQGRGVGRALLEYLILIARDRKIEKMSGFVLAENTHMLSLGRKLGFSLSRAPGESQYVLTIDLKAMVINQEQQGLYSI